MSGNNAPSPKLSVPMSKALRSFYVGQPWAHLSGRSMHGGSNGTRFSMIRRGLITPAGDLTDEGLMLASSLWGSDRAVWMEAVRFLDCTRAELEEHVREGRLESEYGSYRWRDLHALKAAVNQPVAPGP